MTEVAEGEGLEQGQGQGQVIRGEGGVGLTNISTLAVWNTPWS